MQSHLCLDHHSAEWRKHVAVISAADAGCDLGVESLQLVLFV